MAELPNPFLSNSLFQQVSAVFEELSGHDDLKILEKEKGPAGPVSKLDIEIHNWVELNLGPWMEEHGIHFLSEESADHSLKYPAVILDPVDGTRQWMKGGNDFCLAFGWHSDENCNPSIGSSMIYSPKHQLSVTNWDLMPLIDKKLNLRPLTLVAGSEYRKGLFDGFEKELEIQTMGSAALKLAYLAKGSVDCVISLRQKALWDIAAGTQLCSMQGLEFYSEGKKIDKLDRLKWRPPLIWCKKENSEKLLAIFK